MQVNGIGVLCIHEYLPLLWAYFIINIAWVWQWLQQLCCGNEVIEAQ